MKNIIALMAMLSFFSCSKENDVPKVKANPFYFFNGTVGTVELHNHSLLNTNTGVSTGVEARLYTRNDSSFLELKVLVQEWASMSGNCNVFLKCRKAGVEASGLYFPDANEPNYIEYYVFSPNITKTPYPFHESKPIELSVLAFDAAAKFIWADLKAESFVGVPINASFRARTP